MAIAETSLAAGADTSNISSYNTASQSPTGNSLQLAAIVNVKASLPETPTLSGNGITWVQLATVAYNTIATPLKRLTLFRGMVASPSAGALTIDFGGVSQTGCAWIIVEYSGVDTSGTDGSAAVGTPVTNRLNGVAAGGTIGVTLAAFSDAANWTYLCAASNVNTAGDFSPEAGYTERGEQHFSVPNAGLAVEDLNANDTGPNYTTAAGGDLGAIGVEIKVPSGAATTLFRRTLHELGTRTGSRQLQLAA